MRLFRWGAIRGFADALLGLPCLAATLRLKAFLDMECLKAFLDMEFVFCNRRYVNGAHVKHLPVPGFICAGARTRSRQAGWGPQVQRVLFAIENELGAARLDRRRSFTGGDLHKFEPNAA